MTRDQRALKTGSLSMDMLPEFGIQMMEDGQIRFGEKTLKGVGMSDSASGQARIMKNILNWYSPCFQNQDDDYQIDMDCVSEMEEEYLQRLAKKVLNLRFKYIL